MGIVNRTPDSFYAAARYTDLEPGLAAVDRLLAEGADLIDVGGVRAGQQGERGRRSPRRSSASCRSCWRSASGTRT